ncbi:hypothetical protein NQ315_005626 [Exocentrus adspersus]|uniref:Uncharacterized protein n=1 Tax=Exocentrus adspersus TaxID=1586481 RepID=A0AAV8V7W6_9CUCU|nr:hypothetical protein NQ315_005626 [Exocentrus adspersus]
MISEFSFKAGVGKEPITLCILFLTHYKSVYGTEAENNTKEEKSEDLVESESKDGKLEIIKRIKKINDDGSYTIGYEADDGSFKIESRDVLGQIKGTYGFVDEEGQIKRVSYSTSNSSEIITTPESTVVQRIPNKTKTTSTRLPITTQSTPTTANSVVQSIARRRSTTSTTTSTTTQKPNYSEVINVGSRPTIRPSTVIYASTPPRILVQNRLPITSTVATQTHTAKSEGQIIRPEIVPVKPTELPLFRRLTFKQFEDDKPVTEEPEPETRGNILRRQLSQDNAREYKLNEHLYSLQQSLGHDATDVYSASMTTGTPRPLFTTTNRPRIVALPSPTTSASENPRPTIRYPVNYQRNVLEDLEKSTQDYTTETTTSQPVTVSSTQTPVSVVEIPPNRGEPQEPLVAIRHPFQRGTILVPLSQLQGRLIPVENIRDINEHPKQYNDQRDQYFRETTNQPNLVEIEQQQAVVRRLPPPPLRPIPVQVDENGFIREMPRQVQPPYPIPVSVPVVPVSRQTNDDSDNDIDNIEPPVSTRDFQKLLQQLITRQSRLEKISALTRQADAYLQDQEQQQVQRYQPVYSQTQGPYYARRNPVQLNGPVQFLHQRPDEVSQRIQPRQFFGVPQQRQIASRTQMYESQYDQQSYRPNRRVARLLPSRAQQRQQEEEYLPPDVREMLLLRMLQLAINPTLPLDEDKFDLPAASTTQARRVPVRNVEILGEEEDEEEEPRRRSERIKRYRDSEVLNY